MSNGSTTSSVKTVSSSLKTAQSSRTSMDTIERRVEVTTPIPKAVVDYYTMPQKYVVYTLCIATSLMIFMCGHYLIKGVLDGRRKLREVNSKTDDDFPKILDKDLHGRQIINTNVKSCGVVLKGGIFEQEFYGFPDHISSPVEGFVPKSNNYVSSATHIADHPWIVYMEAEHQSCVGSIINQDWIIFAAHCVTNQIAEAWNIYAGVSKRSNFYSFAQHYYGKKLFVHSDFVRSNMSNDLALLQVTSQLTFTDFVQPICLPYGVQPVNGSECTVIGWGGTNQTLVADNLQESKVIILEESFCKGQNTTKNDTLCTLSSRNSSTLWYNENGNPLTCFVNGKQYLFGLSSSRAGCNQNYVPGFYNKISNNLRWISTVIKT